MPFELFTDFARGYKPKASIRANGQIGFNRGSIHRFDLKDGYAQLFYNKEEKLIGVRQVESEDVPGATRLVVRHNNAFISAKSMLEYHGVPYGGKTITFEAMRDDAEGLIVINLSKPVAIRRQPVEKRIDKAPADGVE